MRVVAVFGMMVRDCAVNIAEIISYYIPDKPDKKAITVTGKQEDLAMTQRAQASENPGRLFE